jgi:hypothetical protein
MSYINEKSFSGNIFKSLGFFEKASHHFEKASILLKVHLKSLEIFENALVFY